jgi:chaperonin GroES
MHQMNLKPLEDRIVVQPNEAEQTTASGLVIPDTAKEKPQQGKVLAVGPGKRSETSGELIPLGIEVGQTVLYSKYGGTEVTVAGDDLLILASRDVLAIVED